MIQFSKNPTSEIFGLSVWYGYKSMAQSCQCKDVLKMEADTTGLGQIFGIFFWRFGELNILQYFLT